MVELSLPPKLPLPTTLSHKQMENIEQRAEANAGAEEHSAIVASMSKLMDQLCVISDDEEDVDDGRNYKKAKPCEPDTEKMDTSATDPKSVASAPRKPPRSVIKKCRLNQGVMEIARQQAVATNAFMDLCDDIEAEEEDCDEFGEFKHNRETFKNFTSAAPIGTHRPRPTPSTALMLSSAASILPLPPWPMNRDQQVPPINAAPINAAPSSNSPNNTPMPPNGIRPTIPPDI